MAVNSTQQGCDCADLYAQAALLVGHWRAVCERGESKRKGKTRALFPSLPRQQVFSVGGPAPDSL